MKKVASFLLIACCICLAGCSRDAEINAFIAECNSTTGEIVQKIDANPSAAGIDDAQKVFDGKKASLKAKLDGIKGVMEMQVSADVRKKLKETVMKNISDLKNVSAKFEMDKEASTKFQALLKEYQEIFLPPAEAK